MQEPPKDPKMSGRIAMVALILIALFTWWIISVA